MNISLEYFIIPLWFYAENGVDYFGDIRVGANDNRFLEVV